MTFTRTIIYILCLRSKFKVEKSLLKQFIDMMYMRHLHHPHHPQDHQRHLHHPHHPQHHQRHLHVEDCTRGAKCTSSCFIFPRLPSLKGLLHIVGTIPALYIFCLLLHIFCTLYVPSSFAKISNYDMFGSHHRWEVSCALRVLYFHYTIFLPAGRHITTLVHIFFSQNGRRTCSFCLPEDPLCILFAHFCTAYV